jgi:hypothetical protein
VKPAPIGLLAVAGGVTALVLLVTRDAVVTAISAGSFALAGAAAGVFSRADPGDSSTDSDAATEADPSQGGGAETGPDSGGDGDGE